VWNLYLAWRNMTSFKQLRAVHADTGFHTTWLMVSELTGLKSCWLFFMEYHARISMSWNISLFRCGRSWTTDIWLQLSDSGDATSMRVTWVWKLRGIFWPTFALNLHVALWAISWIVGLYNIYHLTLLPADFECFVSYYSRFCAFCVWYGFNSSYYHINKPLRIYAVLCHVWIIPNNLFQKL